MDDDAPRLETTTREQIADMQAQRLPSLARKLALQLRPKEALEAAIREDALELAAAEVVESGRAFRELGESERRAIYERYDAYCRQRNLAYLHALETMN